MAKDEEPAGSFADEHLCGLDYRHREAADLGWVGGIAVGDALNVLACLSRHEAL